LACIQAYLGLARIHCGKMLRKEKNIYEGLTYRVIYIRICLACEKLPRSKDLLNGHGPHSER
jgi:hypothetical protein